MLVASGRAYSKDFLKKEWEGTDREGYRYKVEYSPSGAATCRQSKTVIAKGALRIGRMTPSPFDAEGGHSDLTHYYHEEHAWTAFARSRCTSAVPLKTSDLQGFDDLKKADQARVRKSIAAFKKTWQAKCSRNERNKKKDAQ